jgi:hypothetical protein
MKLVSLIILCYLLLLAIYFKAIFMIVDNPSSLDHWILLVGNVYAMIQGYVVLVILVKKSNK